MNKLAVISGGTKGIGLALVRAFAAENFDIITCSRNKKDLLALKEKIEKEQKDITLYTFKANLSKKKEVKAMVEYILSQDRQIDVLINNSGLFLPGQVHSEKDGVLEHMIETNLYSAYYLTKGLVSDMIKRRDGHIFNICSTASIVAYTNGGSYGISKSAMLAMSRVLREELKPFGIRVTSVLPGATLTASWEGADIPPERFMKPEDIAQTILNAYFLSERSVVEEILIRPQEGDL